MVAEASAQKATGSAVLPTILIVDDSPTIRAVVNKALKSNFTNYPGIGRGGSLEYLEE